MYTAPDYVKVSVKIKDIFASYTEACSYDFHITYSHSGLNCQTEIDEYNVFVDTVEFWYECMSEHLMMQPT